MASDAIRQKAKRQFTCLVYAKDAFESAKATATLCLNKTELNEIYYALIATICVTYARPFTDGDLIGRLPNKFSRFQDATFRETHSTLMDARNSLYAHTDGSKLDHHAVITATNLGLGYKLSYGVWLPRLANEILPRVSSLCDFQLERLNPSINELLPQVLDTGFDAVIAAQPFGVPVRYPVNIS